MHGGFLGVLLTLTLATAVPADDRAVDFAGERFICRSAKASDERRCAEYTREGETIDNWTKLVSVWHFPLLQGTPTEGAAAVIRRLQENHPESRFDFFRKDDNSEAMISFITWPEDYSYAEFNIFRYMRKPGLPGLVAYQFAYRFDGQAANAANRIREQRGPWLEAIDRLEIPTNFEPLNK